MPQSAVPTIQIDDERVRVTLWEFAPGAETGFHIHEMDYVVVPLADGKLEIVAPDGGENSVEMKRGVSYARRAGVHHNVINANDSDYSFIEIELMRTPEP